MSVGGDGDKKLSSSSAARTEPTLLNLITNVRTGQLTTGPLKPNRWLVYSVGEKTAQEKSMERKMEKLMESCTFKATMSCVIGNRSFDVTYTLVSGTQPLAFFGERKKWSCNDIDFSLQLYHHYYYYCTATTTALLLLTTTTVMIINLCL